MWPELYINSKLVSLAPSVRHHHHRHLHYHRYYYYYYYHYYYHRCYYYTPHEESGTSISNLEPSPRGG